MTEFNFGQDVVEVGSVMDPFQVERELREVRSRELIRGIGRRVGQEQTLRAAQVATRRSANALPASGPGSRSGGAGREDPPGSVPAERKLEATSETIQDRCKAEWNQNAELRSEFSTLARYTAYCKAAERDRVRIFGRAETCGPRSRRKRTRPAEPSAEELIRRWKSSPELRTEFKNDFSRFISYERAVARGATPARV